MIRKATIFTFCSEAQFRELVDAVLEAVIGMAADGRLIDWHHQAEEIFGWSRQEARGGELAYCVVPPYLRAAHHHGVNDICVVRPGFVFEDQCYRQKALVKHYGLRKMLICI